MVVGILIWGILEEGKKWGFRETFAFAYLTIFLISSVFALPPIIQALNVKHSFQVPVFTTLMSIFGIIIPIIIAFTNLKISQQEKIDSVLPYFSLAGGRDTYSLGSGSVKTVLIQRINVYVQKQADDQKQTSKETWYKKTVGHILTNQPTPTEISMDNFKSQWFNFAVEGYTIYGTHFLFLYAKGISGGHYTIPNNAKISELTITDLCPYGYDQAVFDRDKDNVKKILKTFQKNNMEDISSLKSQ